MKNLWWFLLFGFIVLMHATWARAEVTIRTNYLGDNGTPTVNAIVMQCHTQMERDLCYSDCIDKAWYSGKTLVSYTCKGWDERMNLVCGCDMVSQNVGPYIPTCYFNCGGRSDRSGAGRFDR